MTNQILCAKCNSAMTNNPDDGDFMEYTCPECGHVYKGDVPTVGDLHMQIIARAMEGNDTIHDQVQAYLLNCDTTNPGAVIRQLNEWGLNVADDAPVRSLVLWALNREYVAEEFDGALSEMITITKVTQAVMQAMKVADATGAESITFSLVRKGSEADDCDCVDCKARRGESVEVMDPAFSA